VLRLITIPISHYCEKARRALDRTGLPYREERPIRGIHQLSLLADHRGAAPAAPAQARTGSVPGP